MKKAVAIRFFQGVDEKVHPEIILTKSKDGQSGQAIFRFDSPEALLSDNFKDIQGMYLIDEEGQITTREINIAVSKKNGKYTAIEAVYCWRSERDFNRFMRFANRYARKVGLTFQESH
mgnify:CR=1 FL=1|tara:strand:+ start:1107 stop:1460 length:354 start_codon:yes stop_codon:yes gene_type:complete